MSHTPGYRCLAVRFRDGAVCVTALRCNEYPKGVEVVADHIDVDWDSEQAYFHGRVWIIHPDTSMVPKREAVS